MLAYDGAAFHGWQRQPDRRTVQGVVEESVRRVLREPVDVIGASRTDAGVHARGQVAHVQTDSPIPIDKLHSAVGHRLPEDVCLLRVRDAAADFNAIRDARSKRYRYRIFNHALRPATLAEASRTWHVWRPLDLDRMRAAAVVLLGRHDFRSFASSGDQRASGVRTIFSLDVERRYETVQIDVSGDGFLYNMVRNVVGTLVEIGRGHWPPERMSSILAACDRRAAGPTAPAHGLTLMQIAYPPQLVGQGTQQVIPE